MVNPFSTIIFSFLNTNRHQTQHQPQQQSNEASYFLSYGSLILGTSTVMLSTLIISYYFNLKPYTYLKSAVSTMSYILAEDVSSRRSITDNSYENRYFEEYDTWLESKKTDTANDTAIDTDTLNNMYYLTIRDTINDIYGDIIMCYDNATQSFAYYAKTANIPYKYLETAARKYVIDTDADKSIYIDIRKEYEKARNKLENKSDSDSSSGILETQINNADEGDDSTLYVKFKSYNTASNIPVNDIHTKKMTALESVVLSSVSGSMKGGGSASNTKQGTILRENANRYSYRGKLTDYEIHHENFLADKRMKTKTETEINSITTEDNNKDKMSYQEFKKKQRINK
jgi:hypothetical protein